MTRKSIASTFKPNTTAYEAVMFFGERGILKEMLLTEFEAVLDGVLGMADFAGQKMRAAYSLISPDLCLQACVLFTIEFDLQGRADRDWNIPLRHLASNAGPGPDLGSGPIRLACRSQCAVAWFQQELWEHSQIKDINVFIALRDAIQRNRLGLVPLESSAFEPPIVGDIVDLPDDPGSLWQEQLQQDYQQELDSLQQQHKKELQQIQRAMRNELQVYRNRCTESEQTAVQQQVRNDKLQRQCEQLEQTLQQLQQQYDQQRQRFDLLKDEHLELLKERSESISASELDTLKQRLMAAQQAVSEQQAQQDQLQHAKQTLSDENEALVEELERLKGQSDDRLLEKMAEHEMICVVYHPGAGHISLPVRNLEHYFENPALMAARRCSVSLELYQNWLAHYEHPVCQHCDVPLARIDTPNDFKDGHHNYCSKHRKSAFNLAEFRRTV